MLNDNILLLTDSYKVSHAKQYPPNTSNVYSYFESRGGEFKEVVFFGLQYFIKRYLEGQVVTKEKIDEAEQLFAAHFGNPELFNRAGWEHILEKHGGRLPVVIKAVPEGTVLPTRNVLMTIENTDPKCWWLTNYLETLLVQIWYTCTVATISREMKKIIKSALERSGTIDDGLMFKLHDFGCRGVSSMESAAIGGGAHLVNFLGTDTIPALQMLRDFYDAPMAGHSIPAAEHSTVTSWGKEGEVDAFRNMLQQFPTGPVAVVSDSWDIFHAAKDLWGRELKDEVLKRDGFVVVRPDSGDPVKVVPELLKILHRELGGTTNDKGYIVLPDQVRVIQGDGINRHTLAGILDAAIDAGFSADNLAFGSGGGLLQQLNRDTCSFAFKCSSVVVDNKQKDVFKQPATMSSKNSKKGRLKLVKHDSFRVATGGSPYLTVPENFNFTGVVKSKGGESWQRPHSELMLTVFKDGKLIRESSLSEIRREAAF